MYKAIIIDDEPIVCAGLHKYIPWEKCGFTVEKTFTVSAEALSYLKNNHADLVLTDIEMPVISGIDIAKYVFENKPGTVVCFVSGHRNFEYAKSALKYGVVDYIVKPTDVPETARSLMSIKQRLDSDNKVKELSGVSDENIYELARNQLIFDVFTGFVSNKSEINNKVRMLKKVGHNDFKYGSFWFVFNNDKNKHSHSVQDYLEELYAIPADFRFQALIVKSHKAFVIVVGKARGNAQEYKDKICDLLDEFKKRVSEKYMVESEYKINTFCDNMDDFIDYMFQPFVPSDDEMMQQETLDILNEKFKSLFSAVTICDKSRLATCFVAIKNILSKLTDSVLKKIFMNFFSVFFHKLPNATEGQFSWFELQSMQKISAGKTQEEIFAAVEQILNETIEIIEHSDKSNSTNFFVKKACMYVENHYMENITVELMANYLFLNASYFSRMFKVCMHENFKKYLSKIRIAKALEIYRSGNYTTAQISEMVGYKSPKYFRQQFKNIMGKNFSQYLIDLGYRVNANEEDC